MKAKLISFTEFARIIDRDCLQYSLMTHYKDLVSLNIIDKQKNACHVYIKFFHHKTKYSA